MNNLTFKPQAFHNYKNILLEKEAINPICCLTPTQETSKQNYAQQSKILKKKKISCPSKKSKIAEFEKHSEALHNNTHQNNYKTAELLKRTQMPMIVVNNIIQPIKSIHNHYYHNYQDNCSQLQTKPQMEKKPNTHYLQLPQPSNDFCAKGVHSSRSTIPSSRYSHNQNNNQNLNLSSKYSNAFPISINSSKYQTFEQLGVKCARSEVSGDSQVGFRMEESAVMVQFFNPKFSLAIPSQQ